MILPSTTTRADVYHAYSNKWPTLLPSSLNGAPNAKIAGNPLVLGSFNMFGVDITPN